MYFSDSTKTAMTPAYICTDKSSVSEAVKAHRRTTALGERDWQTDCLRERNRQTEKDVTRKDEASSRARAQE